MCDEKPDASHRVSAADGFMMSTFENAPPLDGWQLPPRCCGTWCTGVACEVCGRHARDIPANIGLGEN